MAGLGLIGCRGEEEGREGGRGQTSHEWGGGAGHEERRGRGNGNGPLVERGAGREEGAGRGRV